MLPLIPLAMAMTLLMSASLFVATPSSQRQATTTLADDMLRYHQSVNQAVRQTIAGGTPSGPTPTPTSVTLDPWLDDEQKSLDLGPFKPLSGWQSAIADEIDPSGSVIARWVVTWPADWKDSRPRQKADLASIPGRLRAAGYRNSRFGTWSAQHLTSVSPEGFLDGLRLRGVDIPEGAPVIANLARLP